MLVVLAACALAGDERRLTHGYYALRHGESLANVAHVISSDPRVATVRHGLSARGREQAAAAAASVAAEAAAAGFDGVAIVSSDLRRAWQTASIARAHLLAAGVRVWPEASGVLEARALRERSFGDLDGGPDDRYPDVWVHDAVSAAHTEYAVEPIDSVLQRARGVVDELERALPSGRWMVVLVAHGDVLQIAQTAFAGVDPRAHRSLDHLPTATLRLLARAGFGPWTASDAAQVDARWRSNARWPPPVS